MTVAALSAPLTIGWLRGRQFDLWFIYGIALIAIASGLVVSVKPELFWPILILDIWLLGYQHVVATYTRLCFDWKSFHENRFFILYLPIICLAACVLLAKGFGAWTLTTIYLYWQWFHYTRQSWGVSQLYRRKEGHAIQDDPTHAMYVFYSVPLLGIVYRMYQQPDEFLFTDVWTPEVPGFVVAILALATVGLVLHWMYTRFLAWQAGRLAVAQTLYISSHFLVFLFGYVLIEDITHGWLVINIWHNVQYILFVWVFNSNKFREGETQESRLLSHISQKKNWWKYFAFCFMISTSVYAMIEFFEPALAIIGLAPLIIIYQTINFHHYIVDSFIWKSRSTKKLVKQ